MVLVLVFLGLVLLRVLAVGIGAALIIRPVRSCPACFQATLPIRKKWLRPARAYEWRWCPACGWQGVGRRVPAGPLAAQPPEPRRPWPRGERRSEREA